MKFAAKKAQPATIAIILIVTISIFTFILEGGSLPFSKNQVSNQTPQVGNSTHAVLYGGGGAKSPAELFQYVKGMVLQFNYSSSKADSNGSVISRTSETISYLATLVRTEDGEFAYKVNLTDTESSGNYQSKGSALVWVNPVSSYIIEVSMKSEDWTGSSAQRESGALSFLTTNYLLSILNSTTAFPISTNHTLILKNTLLYVSDYAGLPSLARFEHL